jgi:hypothetical protein
MFLSVLFDFLIKKTHLVVGEDNSAPWKRRCFSTGANPVRQLSLQPVAIRAVVEATKRLKPLM